MSKTAILLKIERYGYGINVFKRENVKKNSRCFKAAREQVAGHILQPRHSFTVLTLPEPPRPQHQGGWSRNYW